MWNIYDIESIHVIFSAQIKIIQKYLSSIASSDTAAERHTPGTSSPKCSLCTQYFISMHHEMHKKRKLWQQNNKHYTDDPEFSSKRLPKKLKKIAAAADTTATTITPTDRKLHKKQLKQHYSNTVRGTVVERRSLTGELSLSCTRPAADGWPLVCKPSAVGQPTRPTQPFILSGVDKWVVGCN